MRSDVNGGAQTMCAMAAAPRDYLNKLLTTLKLILTGAKHTIKPGAQIGIIDLMTVSNAMLVEAMKNFPNTSTHLVFPNHVALGNYITIVSDGFTSLTEEELGKDMSFLDINRALRKGQFGFNPPTWGDAEWSNLINNVCAGIDFDEGDLG